MTSKWLTAIAALAAAAPVAAQSDPASLERTIPKFEAQPVEKQSRVAAPSLPSEAGVRVTGTFVLSAVSVEGATVFSSQELAESFEPYLASNVGQAELEKIAADITDRYRQAGYILSYATVPEQSVASGIVRIRVIEGYVEKVRIQGDPNTAAAVHRILAQVAVDRPLKTSTLERVLGLAREVPGVVLGDTQLSRTPGDPTRHQLTVVLSGNRVRGLLYTDNRGTIEGARVRGYASVSIASVAVPGDQLQLDAFTIPSDNFRFFYGQAKATVPLGPNGLRFAASVSLGDQFQKLSGPNQRGRSRQFIADLAYPFAKSRAFSLVGHASLADWRSKEKRSGTAIQRDRLYVARGWIEFARVSQTRIDGRLAISQGLDLGLATRAGDPLASRPFASSKFTKFSADVQIGAPVSERVSVRLDTSAQYSTRPLLAPEEFALGGSRIGRAFDFNDVTGDHGLGSMLEIGYRVGDVRRGPKALELLAFVDGGGAFRKHPSPGFPEKQWLASAGIGSRFSVLGLQWAGELGVPIARSNNVDRDIRAFISVAKVF